MSRLGKSIAFAFALLVPSMALAQAQVGTATVIVESTDLRKTFARIRREAREHARPAAPKDAPATANVLTLERARKSAV